MRLITLLVILQCLFCACTQRAVTSRGGCNFIYAKNITMEQCDGYVLVTMANPWKPGETLHRYILIERGDSVRVSASTVPEGTVVYVPLRRSVVFNTAHASLIGMLDKIDRRKAPAMNNIAGVADLKYMQLPDIHRRVKGGSIVDCGNSMSPDIEKIVDMQADAILLSPFENSGGYGRLERIGIPVIECADYMEKSALGRAEWMLFYGILYGKLPEATALFAEVEKQYKTLSHQAKILTKHSIITEKMTGNTWFVAGGKSTVGQLIADAGGSYAWSDDKHSGSMAMPFEMILDKAGNADVWVFNDVNDKPTYAKLEAEFHGYRQLKAFRERNVWYVNSMKVPYFEEVSFRPDYLLRDYMIVLHPEQKGLGSAKYFRRLADE